MEVELLTIGDELLRGTFPNTNAFYIASLLSQQGWKVVRQTTIPDQEEALYNALNEAFLRASIVITTGGLGPTLDDITRSVIAKLFRSDFYFDEKVAADLTARYGSQLVSLKDQATIPSKAIPLLNEVGTAPGLIFQSEKNCVICLPGVPVEMERMMSKQVIPYLQQSAPPKEKRVSEKIHFCSLNESALDQVIRKCSLKGVEIGIYPGYATVTVCLFARSHQEIAPIKEALTSAFSTHIFRSESGRIEEAIHSWMVQNGKKLALAESCTGGKMAAHLTSFPGASDYFLGSLVTYSNSLKEQILHIPHKVIERHGAVSKETVSEMALHLLEITGADYGIAISGIAGPTGGTQEKPVGTIWAALIEKGHPPHAWRFKISGNREKIIETSSIRALSALYRRIVYHIFPAV